MGKCHICGGNHGRKVSCEEVFDKNKLDKFTRLLCSVTPEEAAKIHRPVDPDKMPAKLYHGTSAFHWNFGYDAEGGINKLGLKGDIPRIREVDFAHLGYVFLTDAIKEAPMFALQTHAETIQRYEPLQIMRQREPANFAMIDKGVIIEVDVSKLPNKEHLLEYDPECADWDMIKKVAESDSEVKKFYESSVEAGLASEWYRYRGTIPRDVIRAISDVPVRPPPGVRSANTAHFESFGKMMSKQPPKQSQQDHRWLKYP